MSFLTMESRANPMYSVIILTRNREKILPLALRAIVEQTMPPSEYEVLIIDDASTDRTQARVQEFIDGHRSWQVFYHRLSQSGGEAHGRNEGLKLARGEYIFFTDDDCIVPPNWIEHYVKIYSLYPEVVGAGGIQVTPPALVAKSKYTAYVDFKRFWYKALDVLAQNSSSYFLNRAVGNTANMSYKKEALLAVEGFEEGQDFSGSVDFEVKRKIFNRGWLLYYTPLVVFHLKEMRSLSELFRFGIIRGRGARFIAEKSSDLYRRQYGYSKWRYIKSEAMQLRNSVHEEFVRLHFVEQLGRTIGWQYAKLFGPHPRAYEKWLSMRFRL